MQQKKPQIPSVSDLAACCLSRLPPCPPFHLVDMYSERQKQKSPYVQPQPIRPPLRVRISEMSASTSSLPPPDGRRRSTATSSPTSPNGNDRASRAPKASVAPAGGRAEPSEKAGSPQSPESRPKRHPTKRRSTAGSPKGKGGSPKVQLQPMPHPRSNGHMSRIFPPGVRHCHAAPHPGAHVHRQSAGHYYL